MAANDGERPNTIIKNCLWCESDFTIPRCRDWREHCCSSECKKAYRASEPKKRARSRTRACLECGSTFTPRQTQIDKGQGVYCSIKCSTAAIQKSGVLHTAEAKAKRTAAFKKSDYYKNIPRGLDHPQALPQVSKNGYTWVHTDDGLKAEHRLVMEKSINRKLTTAEVVHHKNGIKTDNRIENLQIMSRAEHLLEHLPDILKERAAK